MDGEGGQSGGAKQQQQQQAAAVIRVRQSNFTGGGRVLVRVGGGGGGHAALHSSVVLALPLLSPSLFRPGFYDYTQLLALDLSSAAENAQIFSKKCYFS